MFLECSRNAIHDIHWVIVYETYSDMSAGHKGDTHKSPFMMRCHHSFTNQAKNNRPPFAPIFWKLRELPLKNVCSKYLAINTSKVCVALAVTDSHGAWVSVDCWQHVYCHCHWHHRNRTPTNNYYTRCHAANVKSNVTHERSTLLW